MSSTRGPDIVYLAPEDLLTGLFSRSQALAIELARYSRILYANPRCSPLRYILDRLFKPEIPHPIGLRLARPRLWTLDSINPLPHTLAGPSNSLNLMALAFRLRRAIRKLGFRDYMVWVGTPWMTPILDHLSASRVCYDYMDEFPALFQDELKGLAARLEDKLLRRSDLVIATADLLAGKAKRFTSNVHVVRNGVFIDHYTDERSTCPPELQSLPRPILGYMGSIEHWLDVRLLADLARKYARGSLVLVGRGQYPNAEFAGLTNVHYLGHKPHSEVPRYLAAFDVCLIPFILNDLTIAVNPIKFYEHCAAAKPTVSIRLPELEPYRDICYLADSRDEFIRLVDLALHEADDPARSELLACRRRAVAEENSWDARGNQLHELLSAAPRDSSQRLHVTTKM